MKPNYKTDRYGKFLITASAAESWNKISKQFKNMLFKYLSPNKIKTVVSNIYLKSYQQLWLIMEKYGKIILIVLKCFQKHFNY